MTKLVRGLGPWGAASLVVGTIIGTGVFLKTAVMAQLGGSALWVLIAWAVAGALSFFGAMTYAELGGMFPAAGGEYVYLRRGYGPAMGYLYAWNRFWIATPGSIAAYAVGAATFAGGFGYDVVIGPVEVDATKVIGAGLIVAFTAVNLMNIRSGGALNTAMTVIKIAIIVAIAFGAFIAPAGALSQLTGEGRDSSFPGWSAFGAMTLAALWAYDGWNNLPMAAGEVRDPQRNVPRAIVLGTIVVFLTYAVVNLGYFFALPFDEVASSSSSSFPDAPAVATKVAAQFLGTTAAAVLAGAMVLCALSAMNGSMLTGARVPFAVARDHLAPAPLARISDRTRIPTIAVVVQSVLAIGLSFSGRFDQLTDAVVFSSWLFYALNAGSVIVLRYREPARPRSFRTPGVPVVPILFVIAAALLLVNTVYTTLIPSLLGLAMTGLGAAVYAIAYRGKARPLGDEDESEVD